jgi:hypothetical protein
VYCIFIGEKTSLEVSTAAMIPPIRNFQVLEWKAKLYLESGAVPEQASPHIFISLN